MEEQIKKKIKGNEGLEEGGKGKRWWGLNVALVRRVGGWTG